MTFMRLEVTQKLGMCTALAENLSLILNSHIKQLASLGARLGHMQLKDRDRETETGEE